MIAGLVSIDCLANGSAIKIYYRKCLKKDGTPKQQGILHKKEGETVERDSIILATKNLRPVRSKSKPGQCLSFPAPTAEMCEAADVLKDGDDWNGLRCSGTNDSGRRWKKLIPLGPVTAGSRMVVHLYRDEGTLMAATNLYGLFALNAKTGKLLWRAHYQNIRWPPTISPNKDSYILAPLQQVGKPRLNKKEEKKKNNSVE